MWLRPSRALGPNQSGVKLNPMRQSGQASATPSSGGFVPSGPSYMLREDGSFLLRQDGSKILREE